MNNLAKEVKYILSLAHTNNFNKLTAENNSLN